MGMRAWDEYKTTMQRPVAAYAGHLGACELLLAHVADVNGADSVGNTVLMGAAFKGHLDIVRRFLQQRGLSRNR
jgi:ankyrin repeat protein